MVPLPISFFFLWGDTASLLSSHYLEIAWRAVFNILKPYSQFKNKLYPWIALQTVFPFLIFLAHNAQSYSI